MKGVLFSVIGIGVVVGFGVASASTNPNSLSDREKDGLEVLKKQLGFIPKVEPKPLPQEVEQVLEATAQELKIALPSPKGIDKSTFKGKNRSVKLVSSEEKNKKSNNANSQSVSQSVVHSYSQLNLQGTQRKSNLSQKKEGAGELERRGKSAQQVGEMVKNKKGIILASESRVLKIPIGKVTKPKVVVVGPTPSTSQVTSQREEVHPSHPLPSHSLSQSHSSQPKNELQKENRIKKGNGLATFLERIGNRKKEIGTGQRENLILKQIVSSKPVESKISPTIQYSKQVGSLQINLNKNSEKMVVKKEKIGLKELTGPVTGVEVKEKGWNDLKIIPLKLVPYPPSSAKVILLEKESQSYSKSEPKLSSQPVDTKRETISTFLNPQQNRIRIERVLKPEEREKSINRERVKKVDSVVSKLAVSKPTVSKPTVSKPAVPKTVLTSTPVLSKPISSTPIPPKGTVSKTVPSKLSLSPKSLSIPLPSKLVDFKPTKPQQSGEAHKRDSKGSKTIGQSQEISNLSSLPKSKATIAQSHSSQSHSSQSSQPLTIPDRPVSSNQPEIHPLFRQDWVTPKMVSIRQIDNWYKNKGFNSQSHKNKFNLKGSTFPTGGKETIKNQPGTEKDGNSNRFIDRPRPFTLFDIGGKSFTISENYIENLPYHFTFNQQGVAKLTYRGKRLGIVLEKGIINFYTWEGRRIAYFQKLASDPQVGLIVIGHSLDKSGKVRSVWLDFWQNRDYIPLKTGFNNSLPLSYFWSWTSKWWRQFRFDGIVDYFLYNPIQQKYFPFYAQPFSLQNGKILIQDGNLFKQGNSVIETTYSEQISPFGQVGRYQIVEVTFNSSITIRSPKFKNIGWEGLTGNWIGSFFKLLPEGKIQFSNPQWGTGNYKIEGNRLIVTYLWEGKYPFTDIYLLDPTVGTIQNSFSTTFREIVSANPILKYPTKVEIPTTPDKNGIIKGLFIEEYIHHLKRKHFY